MELKAHLNEAFTARYGEAWSKRWTQHTRELYWWPLIERYPEQTVMDAIAAFVGSKGKYCPSPAEFDDEMQKAGGDKYDKANEEFNAKQDLRAPPEETERLRAQALADLKAMGFPRD